MKPCWSTATWVGCQDFLARTSGSTCNAFVGGFASLHDMNSWRGATFIVRLRESDLEGLSFGFLVPLSLKVVSKVAANL